MPNIVDAKRERRKCEGENDESKTVEGVDEILSDKWEEWRGFGALVGFLLTIADKII